MLWSNIFGVVACALTLLLWPSGTGNAVIKHLTDFLCTPIKLPYATLFLLVLVVVVVVVVVVVAAVAAVAGCYCCRLQLFFCCCCSISRVRFILLVLFHILG